MSHRLKFYLLIGLQLVFLLGLIGTKIYTLKTGTKILLEVVPVDPRDIFRGEYARLNYKISTISFTNTEAGKLNADRGNVVYVTIKKGDKFWDFEAISKEAPEIQGSDRLFIAGKVLYKNKKIISHLGNFHDMTVEGWLEKNPDAVNQIKKIESWYADWKQGDTIYIPFVQKPDKTWEALNFNIRKDINQIQRDSYLGSNIVIVSAEVISLEETENLSVEYGIESYYVPEGKARGIERGSRTLSKEWVEVAVDKSGDSAINRIFIDGKPVEFQ